MIAAANRMVFVTRCSLSTCGRLTKSKFSTEVLLTRCNITFYSCINGESHEPLSRTQRDQNAETTSEASPLAHLLSVQRAIAARSGGCEGIRSTGARHVPVCGGARCQSAGDCQFAALRHQLQNGTDSHRAAQRLTRLDAESAEGQGQQPVQRSGGTQGMAGRSPAGRRQFRIQLSEVHST